MIGIHVKKDKRSSLEDAILEDIESYSIRAAQIYTHGPQSLSRNKYNEGQLRDTIEESKIALVVHSAYLVTPWNGNAFQIKCLITELIDAHDVGASWLILHLPTKRDHNEVITALGKIRDAIAKYDAEDREKISRVILVLEHKAHKPYDDTDNNMGYMESASIVHFLKLMRDGGFTPQATGFRVGFCLDTAHMFVSHPKRKFTTEASMKRYIDPFIPYIEMFCVLHFNGSFNKYGTGKDKHTIPFSDVDRTWKKDKSGAVYLVNFFKSYHPNMPMIIEWNLGTSTDMKKCMKTLAKLNLIQTST